MRCRSCARGQTWSITDQTTPAKGLVASALTAGDFGMSTRCGRVRRSCRKLRPRSEGSALVVSVVGRRRVRRGVDGPLRGKQGTTGAPRSPRWNRWFADSPLEKDGFEPSVPGRLQAKTPGIGIVLLAAALELRLLPHRPSVKLPRSFSDRIYRLISARRTGRTEARLGGHRDRLASTGRHGSRRQRLGPLPRR
jgi:hypothetical protein